MLNDKYVPVISMMRGTTILSLPEYHYERTWPSKGTKIMIDREILLATIYQPGVQRLFTEGNLWVDDKDFRIELGLESPEEDEADAQGTETSSSLIKLDDNMLNRIVKLMPVVEVEKTLKQLSESQRLEVADYAVDHYLDLKMDRIDMLSEYCHTDIIKAVNMKKDLEA